MSELPQTPVLAKPESLLRVPVGLASPLWSFYAGAAVSGAAWWWMTRWTRPQNLEALFGQTAALEEPVAETVGTVVEAAVDAAPTLETVIETAPETVEAVAAVIEPPVLPEPIGGEAAPVAPAEAAAAPEAVEAEPAPKVRAKKPTPKTA